MDKNNFKFQEWLFIKFNDKAQKVKISISIFINEKKKMHEKKQKRIKKAGMTSSA
jgi:hypothetical protein